MRGDNATMKQSCVSEPFRASHLMLRLSSYQPNFPTLPNMNTTSSVNWKRLNSLEAKKYCPIGDFYCKSSVIYYKKERQRHTVVDSTNSDWSSQSFFVFSLQEKYMTHPAFIIPWMRARLLVCVLNIFYF